tara:strand:- start:993 stop:1460 length:468 start_codon:yes stop_codon:yes gene_type:complete
MNPQGMTVEEKAGLLQLMGQTYGEAHKQDQMIVGQAGNLQPQSQHLKQQFEQVAQIPTINTPPRPGQPAHQQPSSPPPDQVQVVNLEQATRELRVPDAPATPPAAPSAGSQMELDLSEPTKLDKLITLTKAQNLILKEISLKLDNGKTVKGNKQT